MGVVFIFVLGVMGGFALFLAAHEWMKGRETAQKARMARKEQESE